MEQRVRVEIQGGVADVRLARPDKMNALDIPMFEALVEAGLTLAEDRSLRAVVLSGEGRAFCAGLDFGAFQAMAGGGRNGQGSGGDFFAPSGESPANRAQRVAWIWRELPVPVVAAVHGVAYGGGLQIALAADIRIAAPDARLSVREVHWGLIPDMTGTQSLRHLVRLDVAKELTFTGRIVPGTEAMALGLVGQLSETPREAALELAREIAARSPHAVRSAKRLLNTAAVVDVAEGLRREAEAQRALLGSPNQIEAVKANFEKREPAFSDPD